MACNELSDAQLIELLQESEKQLSRATARDRNRVCKTQPNMQKVLCLHSTASPVATELNKFPSAATSLSTHLSSRQACDVMTTNKVSRKVAKLHAGADWYDLPGTVLAPEMRRDLQLLRMRSVLDPKRHYKRSDTKSFLPKFSQMGTIIEGPTDFLSSRISKRERKRTLTEDILATEIISQQFQSKYREIQDANSSGRQAHYKQSRECRHKKSSPT